MSHAPGSRYVFSDFVLSPSRRLLLRGGREVPLIPRYFDLLVLLVERRGQAVHRREIFDAVWRDVVVSDGALSQAVRTLRRALGDDTREPVFIRTVSRHGYSFAFPEVAEEPDEDTPAGLFADRPAPSALAGGPDIFSSPLRGAAAAAGRRWLGATAGGAAAGLVAGILGGLILRFGPGSRATDPVPLVLGLVGLAVGGLGAAGVGAGLAAAEVLVRSFRTGALVAFGALGGGAVGAGAHLLALWTIQGLFGRDLSPVAGGFEGLVLGGAAGLGYALATPRGDGGTGAPGRRPFRAVVVTGLCCAAAAVTLAATGSYLGAMSLDFMAHAFPGSQVGLAPLSRLLGESEPGLVTRLVISGGEGFLFGAGLALGLTRRFRADS